MLVAKPCRHCVILDTRWNKELGETTCCRHRHGGVNSTKRFPHIFDIDEALNPLNLCLVIRLFVRLVGSKLQVVVLGESCQKVNGSVIIRSVANCAKEVHGRFPLFLQHTHIVAGSIIKGYVK